MAPGSQRSGGRGDGLPSLSMVLDSLNRAKEETNVAPAKALKAAFTSAGALLAMIRVSLLVCVGS